MRVVVKEKTRWKTYVLSKKSMRVLNTISAFIAALFLFEAVFPFVLIWFSSKLICFIHSSMISWKLKIRNINSEIKASIYDFFVCVSLIQLWESDWLQMVCIPLLLSLQTSGLKEEILLGTHIYKADKRNALWVELIWVGVHAAPISHSNSWDVPLSTVWENDRSWKILSM